MKGIVITEFLEHVEERHGLAFVDRLLGSTELTTGGAYTCVGTYPSEEFVLLVTGVALATGSTPATVAREFGEDLFARLVVGFPRMVEGIDDALSFLELVNDYIHLEVHKIHPRANTPVFETARYGDHGIEVVYKSDRDLPDLAEGLIVGCARHFGSKADVRRFERADGMLFRVEVSPL